MFFQTLSSGRSLVEKKQDSKSHRILKGDRKEKAKMQEEENGEARRKIY